MSCMGVLNSAAVQDLENVVGDVVAAAGTIAYSGPFTPVFRQLLLAEWSNVLKDAGVPHSAGTSLIKTLQVRVAAQILLLSNCARASFCDHLTLHQTSSGVADSRGSLCCLICRILSRSEHGILRVCPLTASPLRTASSSQKRGDGP